MFIANLMASVLALAMVGASTASLSKVENDAVRSVENTSFVASPKKAYYDPAETYGDTDRHWYNYTGYTLNGYNYDDGWVTGTANSNEGLADADLNASGLFLMLSDSDESNIGSFYAFFDGASCTDTSIDVYVDGVFNGTFETDNYIPSRSGLDVPYTFRIPLADDDPDNFDPWEHYFWLFQHGTAPEPYNPVDILGDIAEGLTGGIVPVAEGIGTGLQSLVQDIFLNADHDGLSVFGIVTICFAGLALALGLSRWVLNFVDTLGARDR